MVLFSALLVTGLVLLIFGANFLVDGATVLARKFNISDLAIGLTIVAFGTSAPELVVNTFASSQGHADIVFGNVIGSNNFNLFIILGITGAITPLAVQSSTAWKEIPISFVAVTILYFMLNDQILSENTSTVLSQWEGGFLLGLFLLFLFYVYRQLKVSHEIEASEKLKEWSIWKTVLYILLGLGGLIFGGKLVVDNAILIAENYGISEKVIGLTVVAAGTSLPELATSVTAALKKNADIAVGNIIGSNIFNFLLILGAAALIRPVAYQVSYNLDLYILSGGTLFLLLAMFTGKQKKLDRWEAILLLLFYSGYTTFLVIQEI